MTVSRSVIEPSTLEMSTSDTWLFSSSQPTGPRATSRTSPSPWMSVTYPPRSSWLRSTSPSCVTSKLLTTASLCHSY
ncbi:hypothetical protein BE20_39560 [Sorangium cellulosum]|nr:hypothetical protein BE20_39560 [Sorangium cellulosum]